MIELLNEQKQTIIQQAVTHGLNPDAPLKPSGVEWLGDIPANWEVKRIKQLSFLKAERILLPWILMKLGHIQYSVEMGLEVIHLHIRMKETLCL